MTFKEMQDRVLLYLRSRPGMDGMIKSVLNEKVNELVISFELPGFAVEESVSVAADEKWLAVPATLYAVEEVKDVTNGKVLHWMEWKEYVQKDESDTGKPQWYVEKGDKIYVYPAPDSAIVLKMWGKRGATVMVEDADVPEIPKDWHPIVVKQAASELCFLVGEDSRGMALKNEALGGISTRQEPRTMARRGNVGQITIQRRK